MGMAFGFDPYYFLVTALFIYFNRVHNNEKKKNLYWYIRVEL